MFGKEDWVPWNQFRQFIRYGTSLISFPALTRRDAQLRLMPTCIADVSVGLWLLSLHSARLPCVDVCQKHLTLAVMLLFRV